MHLFCLNVYKKRLITLHYRRFFHKLHIDRQASRVTAFFLLTPYLQ